MSNQIKRVVPATLQAYGLRATTVFSWMRSELTMLVTQIVEVDYMGGNATQFKTECGQLALTFSTDLMQAIEALTQSVSRSCTNISMSMGGPVVTIAFNERPIEPPTVAAATDDSQANVDALTELKTPVTNRFDVLVQLLADHMAAFEATDWLGVAKDRTRGEIESFNRLATGRCDTARTEINNYIQSQVDSLALADV